VRIFLPTRLLRLATCLLTSSATVVGLASSALASPLTSGAAPMLEAAALEAAAAPDRGRGTRKAKRARERGTAAKSARRASTTRGATKSRGANTKAAARRGGRAGVAERRARGGGAAAALRRARDRASARRASRGPARAAGTRAARAGGAESRDAALPRLPELPAATLAFADFASVVLGDVPTAPASARGAASANATPALATARLAPVGAPERPFNAFSRSAASLLDVVVARARSQLGTRYVLGGAAPGQALDCSAFARYVMEALGVRLPRTAAQQARVGTEVPRDRTQLRPGDLLTFGSARHVSHVGIYLGEGRFIHASVKSGRVIETTIDRNGGLFRIWQGARRLIAADDSSAGSARDAMRGG
jgi:cell wall-associated NlpC family hydrolase